MTSKNRGKQDSDSGVRNVQPSRDTIPDDKELRARAREYLRNHPKTSTATAADLEKLVGELEIHQAELDVQNEELRRIQVELTEVRDRYRDLYEFAPVGYLSLDERGVIRQANLAAARLCGLDRKGLIGTRIERLVVKEDRDACYTLLHRSLTEERGMSRELRLNNSDGRGLWVCAEVSPAGRASGNASGFLMTFTDINVRKKAEESLKQLNGRLEAKIAERTMELEQLVGSLTAEVLQRQGAEGALKDANRLLGNRAAQLRALAGELTLAEQRERRRLAKVLHDHLQQILVAGKYRVSILGRAKAIIIRDVAREIELLLDQCIATSRSLTAELSPPILQEAGLVAGLEWLARWMSDRHGLKVDLAFGEGIPCLAEDVKVLLFESVRELLFNAVKHAHVSEAVVDVRRTENDMLQVTVSDLGQGFDLDKVKAAGEPGGGFGLFGIHERLDMFGGAIEVDSAPGRGSSIRLKVPMSTATPAPKPTIAVEDAAGSGEVAPAALPAEGAPIRVMLADDHLIMRQGLTRLLREEADMKIVGEASDGQEAIELAGKLHPDVILMDLSMPRLNGIEATRSIHLRYPDIRVIGLSMFEEAERAQAMREAGAAAYLAKSGPSRDLIAAIRSCMTRRPE